jgi:hypothetical protein
MSFGGIFFGFRPLQTLAVLWASNN